MPQKSRNAAQYRAVIGMKHGDCIDFLFHASSAIRHDILINAANTSSAAHVG
jgi:hypothetical protein